VAAYRDGKQWRWRQMVTRSGEKPRRLSGTPEVNTKRAALDAERAAVEDYLAGRYAPAEAPTLAAVEADYLASVKLKRSKGLYTNRVNHLAHLVAVFGRMKLDRIEPKAIERYSAEKLALDYAPGTINLHLTALSNVFRWARKNKLIRDLPEVPLLPRVHQSLAEIEFLEQPALDALIAKTEGQMRRMITVAAHTGVRAGELISIQPGDVRNGRLVVTRNFYKGEDRPPKGKKARTIPLSKKAAQAIEEQAQEPREVPQLFFDRDGTRFTYDRLRHASERIGVSGWHVLRHTFGTLLSARGVPLRAIQEWMGHADIKTTMVYAHFSPVMEEAISVLDTQLLWQPGANVLDRQPGSEGDTDG